MSFNPSPLPIWWPWMVTISMAAATHAILHGWPMATSRLWMKGLEPQSPGFDLSSGTAWLWFWAVVLSQVAMPLSLTLVYPQLLTKCFDRHFCISFHTWLQVFTVWYNNHLSDNPRSITMVSRYVWHIPHCNNPYNNKLLPPPYVPT